MNCNKDNIGHTLIETEKYVPSKSVSKTHMEELRSMKRKMRMIKNRESASISRTKKKEYLKHLEDQIKILSNENILLRRENTNMKETIRDLEQK